MIKVPTASFRNGPIVGGDIVVSDSNEAEKAIGILSSELRRPSELAELLEDECPGFEIVPWDSDDEMPIYSD